MRLRRTGGLAVAGLVAGCAVTEPEGGLEGARAGQERVCAEVVAEHDGMTVDRVTTTWEGRTPGGTAIVTVRGQGSIHTCEIDDRLRVREVLHPGH